MKKTLKWAGIVLAALIGVLAVAAAVLYFKGESRFKRSYDVEDPPIVIPADDSTAARGRHLASAVALCEECHGDNLGGGVIFDDPIIATIHASNLTKGRAGSAASTRTPTS